MRLLFSRLQSWFSMLRSDPVGFIVYLLYLVVTVLLSLILHEIAHGYVAYRCGDPTAKMFGRLSLDPRKHLDPLGTICMFAFGIGWAKPVPVNPRYFHKPARDMMLVALAGPLTNFLLAGLCGVLLWLTLTLLPPLQWQHSTGYIFALKTLQAGVIINFGLAWLNLLPIPPLDGSKVVAYFLPMNAALRYLSVERYGFVILLALLFTGLLGQVLGPLVSGSAVGLLSLLGIL